MPTDINKNFLNHNWWETATVDDVKSEIAKGADVNAEDEYGRTPLMFAARDNPNPEIIKTLVELDADIGTTDKDGWTLLAYAASPEIMKTLVNLGADVNAKNAKHRDDTPLMYEAHFNSDPEIIKTLVNLGAKINEENRFGWTPIEFATSNRNPEIIKTFVNLGAEVNNIDDLLMLATSNHNPEIIETLVNLGADVNAKDKNGWTPLMHAAQYNDNPEIMKTLVNLGADVNDIDYLLMRASALNNNPEIIETLVNLGADVNAKGKDGWTPLMHAAQYNDNPEIMKTLVNLGADINKKITEILKKRMQRLLQSVGKGVFKACYDVVAKNYMKEDKSNIDEAIKNYGKKTGKKYLPKSIITKRDAAVEIFKLGWEKGVLELC